jgi:hypothetical protein
MQPMSKSGSSRSTHASSEANRVLVTVPYGSDAPLRPGLTLISRAQPP